jgi:RNA polymerase-binding protein DksA
LALPQGFHTLKQAEATLPTANKSRKTKPKPPASKGGKKPVAKPAKPAAKKPLPAKPSKPVASAKPAPAPAKPVVAPKAPPVPAKPPIVVAGGLPPKHKPKGITIVQPKPVKKPKPKKNLLLPALGNTLLKPGLKKWKPLIQSGPNAPTVGDQFGGIDPANRPKSPFNKKELEHFKQILLRKRAELVGDVGSMEGAALKDSAGALSHVPQHIAEQGSEAYDQSLALDLAQVDRNLIKEIDDALKRIEEGTYGNCELSGKPISRDRLEELPWTRFTIEAARERERRSFRG